MLRLLKTNLTSVYLDFAHTIFFYDKNHFKVQFRNSVAHGMYRASHIILDYLQALTPK